MAGGRPRKTDAEKEAAEAVKGVVLPLPTEENAHLPATYRSLSRAIRNAAYQGEIGTQDAERLCKMCADDCMENTGQSLEEVLQESADAVDRSLRLENLLQAGEVLLGRLEAAYGRIDALRAGLKKKVAGQIERIRALWRAARADPAKAMILIDRNADPSAPGELIEPKWWNVGFFDTWTDPNYLNSLVMAPPGHGKTVSMRTLIAWEIGNQPELRCLLILDKEDRGRKEMGALMRMMRGPYYRALFPEVKILGRDEDFQKTGLRFAVTRKNVTARDYTVEAVGIGSNVNGDRFDRIYGDDFCNPRVSCEQYMRNKITGSWDQVVEQRRAEPLIARIRIIHTPWHPDDKCGQIRRQVERGEAPTWLVDIDRYAIKDAPDGEAIPLWPEKFDQAHYRAEKIKLGAKYACIHKLQAREESRRTLTKLWFWNASGRNLDENDQQVNTALGTAEWWLSLDPAGTAGKTSSDHGVIRGALLYNKYLLLEHVWFHQKTAVDMFDWLCEEIVERWREGRPYTGVILEAQGGTKGMVTTWEAWMQQRLPEKGMNPTQFPVYLAPGANVGVQEITRNRNKMARLIAASPWLQAGIVRFAGERIVTAAPDTRTPMTYCRPVPNSDMARLCSYILNFDGSNNSDAVDAATQIVLVMAAHNRLADLRSLGRGVQYAPPEARPVDAMSRAFAAELTKMRDGEPEPDTAVEEIAAMWSKWGVNKERRAA